MLFAVGLDLAAESESQPSARNLPGAGTERGILGCRLPSRPHLLESWILVFVGPDLSQVPPLSCEPTPVASHGFTRCCMEMPCSVRPRASSVCLQDSVSCPSVWGCGLSPWKLMPEFSPCCEELIRRLKLCLWSSEIEVINVK